VLTGNPDLEPERTVAWEVGFKYGINPDLLGSLTYFKKAFRNQIDSKTLVPADSKFAGDYGYASFVNNAEANATGLEVVLSRERDERLTGSFSYSYMVTEGISEYADQRINYAQWGFPLAVKPFPLSWDQRHTIKADGEFTLLSNIQANLIILYNSARPYTYYPTRDGFLPLDTTKSLLPNNRRMEDVVLVNIKLSRRFEFGESNRYVVIVYADARNVFNRKNIRWIDASGRIGGELSDPGAYYDPRRVHVGVRAEF
jgi:outer membrane receptor for ferrienterochelin and colicin